MTSTPNLTGEQVRELVANLVPLDLIHDRGRPEQPQDAFEAADRILDALRAHGLLSEGAPSEQQVERAANAMQNESGGFFSLESWRHLARVALTAAGVAPQEPSQNETKSGSNLVSLDRKP